MHYRRPAAQAHSRARGHMRWRRRRRRQVLARRRQRLLHHRHRQPPHVRWMRPHARPGAQRSRGLYLLWRSCHLLPCEQRRRTRRRARRTVAAAGGGAHMLLASRALAHRHGQPEAGEIHTSRCVSRSRCAVHLLWPCLLQLWPDICHSHAYYHMAVLVLTMAVLAMAGDGQDARQARGLPARAQAALQGRATQLAAARAARRTDARRHLCARRRARCQRGRRRHGGGGGGTRGGGGAPRPVEQGDGEHDVQVP